MKENKKTELSHGLKELEKELGKSFARNDIIALIIHYADSKNPFFIWDIIGLCSEHNLPFPRMVKDYLAFNAENIRDYANLTEEGYFNRRLEEGFTTHEKHKECIDMIRKRKSEIPDNILKGFGFRSQVGKDVVDEYNVIKHRLDATLTVDEYMGSGLSKTKAFKQVAKEFGMGETTVRDAYNYFKKNNDILDTKIIAANWYNLPLGRL